MTLKTTALENLAGDKRLDVDKIVEGAAKTRLVANFTDNSTLDSFNISSWTDRGVGSLYGVLTNAMTSNHFTVVGGVTPTAAGSLTTGNTNRQCIANSDTAGRLAANFTSDTVTPSDVPYGAIVCFGDLV